MKKIVLTLLIFSSVLTGCSNSEDKQIVTDSEPTVVYEQYNEHKEYSSNDGIIIDGSVDEVYISYGQTEGSFLINEKGELSTKYMRKDFPNLHKDFEFGGSAEFKFRKVAGYWYLTEVNNFVKNELTPGKYAEIRAKLDVRGAGISKEDAIKLDCYCKDYESAMMVEMALENNIYELYPELKNK